MLGLKKYCLIFLILFSVLKAISQTPYFLEDGTRWGYIYRDDNVEQNTATHDIYEHFINGDTLINNINYKILIERTKSHWFFPFPLPPVVVYGCIDTTYIRHDTINNTMHYLTKNGIDSLLYNFNMQVGDTIYNLRWSVAEDSVFIVDSISYMNFYGKQLKVFHTYSVQYPNAELEDEEIIEGIGAKCGLLFYSPWYQSLSSPHIYCSITCFQFRDSTMSPSIIYNNFPPINCPTIDTFQTCLPIGIESRDKEAIIINIFPNPTTKTINIQTENVQSSIKGVIMFDVTGKVVSTNNTPLPPSRGDSSALIDVSALSNGLYFLHIEMSNGQRVVRKVVKE